MSKDNRPTKKTTTSTKKTDSPGRRRLLEILGKGSGATAAVVLPTVWMKPVVNSVLLPAHAQTSPDEDEDEDSTPNCEVATTLNNDSTEDSVFIAVTPQQATPGQEALDGEISGTLDLPPGTYQVVVTVQLASGNNGEDFSGTVTCCSGESTVFSGDFTPTATSTDVLTSAFTVAGIDIDSDGECTISD